MALGEHGRRGGSVTGDVGCLGGDFLDELGAHVLVGIVELDLLGHRDTVLGDGRGTELLVEDDVATGGPRVALTARASLSRTARERLAGVFVELKLFSHILLLFLIDCYDWGSTWMRAYFDDSEDVGLVDDEEIFAVDLDVGAAVLGDEDRVADCDGELDGVAIVVFSAGAERDDFRLLWLLFSGIGNNDAPGGLFFLIDALHEDALTEWLDFISHSVLVVYCCFCFAGWLALPVARGRLPARLAWAFRKATVCDGEIVLVFLVDDFERRLLWPSPASARQACPRRRASAALAARASGGSSAPAIALGAEFLEKVCSSSIAS